MKILIDVPNNSFREIELLIQSGKYLSISDFFLAAAENQLLLEKTPLEGSWEVILQSSNPMIRERRPLEININKKYLSLPSKGLIRTLDIPKAEQLLYPGTHSEDEHELFIWGQINRIFPLKVALRVLSNLLIEKQKNYMDLEEYSKKASRVAQAVRELLVEKTQHVTGKKDSLWAGLPEKNSDKGVSRFKGQFLSYLRKDNIIEGGLGRLKFVNLYRENRSVFIGITEPGLEFCLLENPILDKNDYSSGSLSTDEKECYLKHIAFYVPSEVRAFVDILTLLKEGITRVSSLNMKLKDIWPSTWSDAVVNTQRNGIISRVVELGLVKKVKDGIEVEYKVTDEGVVFLSKAKTSSIGGLKYG